MSSRRQVTITLGRSGQVVKKERSIPDTAHNDYVPLSGSKRPIRERLGDNVDYHHSYGSRHEQKRRRRDGRSWSTSDDDSEDGKEHMPSRQVGRNDLRFKLIRKSLSKRSSTTDSYERNGDLREKLSRNSQYDERKHLPEPRSPVIIKRIPPTRSADDLRHLDSLRKPLAFASDRPRHRSPHRDLGVSRVMSPRIYDDLRHAPSLRSIDVSRPTSFLPKSVGASRTESLRSRAAVPVEAAKSLLRPPLMSSSLQKTSYMLEEPHTVSSLLNSLGLGKYAITFQAEEVDMTALKQMGDNDLKELGIPMGPRKKILLAVVPRTRQQQQRRHS